jgi:hypothetical protein
MIVRSLVLVLDALLIRLEHIPAGQEARGSRQP